MGPNLRYHFGQNIPKKGPNNNNIEICLFCKVNWDILKVLCIFHKDSIIF